MGGLLKTVLEKTFGKAPLKIEQQLAIMRP